jgi:ATP-dependent DNA helicase DinG
LEAETTSLATLDYLDAVFGPGGHLSKVSPSYVRRPGQVALARLVDRAIKEHVHALAEGPCGTGKGIAYAVPATYHAKPGRPIVIATAGLALQEQLVQKDLPLLLSALPWNFTVATLKGRSNYLCRDKLWDSLDTGKLKRSFPIVRWTEETKAGDKHELPEAPSFDIWDLMSVQSEDCQGEECLHFESCFYEEARRRAKSAHLVVTNHHVLGAHLALRQQTDRDLILPEHSVVIIDEAHELPEAVRQFFGFSLTEKSVERLVKQIVAVAEDQSWRDRVGIAARLFFERLRSYWASKNVYDAQVVFDEDSKIDGSALLRVLGEATAACANKEKIFEMLGREFFAKRARKVAEKVSRAIDFLEEALGKRDGNKAYYIEFLPQDRQRLRPRLEARPVHIGGILQKEFFDRTETVVLTSATLTTTQGNFSHIRSELGVPRDRSLELAIPSPFDLEHQGLIVIPCERLPREPKGDEFLQKLTEVFEDVMVACGGRTLGLFTSFRNLEHVYQKLEKRFPIVRQERHGGLGKMELSRRFQSEPDLSLFGTTSFWTGIDVPGDSLLAVVIDKIPFEAPGDPVAEVMKRLDEERFWKWYQGRALMRLRQGAGRLIRSRTDVGVVIICDRRLELNRRYGWPMVKALAPMRITRNLEEIRGFLEAAPTNVERFREAFEEKLKEMRMEPTMPQTLAMSVPAGVF